MGKYIFWISIFVLMISFNVTNILSIKGIAPHVLSKVMVFLNGAFGIIILIAGIAFIIAIKKGEKLIESFFKKKGRRKKGMN